MNRRSRGGAPIGRFIAAPAALLPGRQKAVPESDGAWNREQGRSLGEAATVTTNPMPVYYLDDQRRQGAFAMLS